MKKDNKRLLVESSALIAATYSGIPNVLANFAWWLCKKNYDCDFFIGNTIIPKKKILKAVKLGSGTGLLLDSKWRNMEPNDFSRCSEYAKSYDSCIFTNLRPTERFFSNEYQFIYDFSFLEVLECHTDAVVSVFGKDCMKKLKLNDKNFCISDHVANSLIELFDVEPKRVSVIPLGTDIPSSSFSKSVELMKRRNVEAYCVVIGTLEPRKNIDLVFRFVTENRDFLDRYKLVFIGADGWGETFEDKIKFYGLTDIFEQGRIVKAGYTTNSLKNVLLKLAAFSIYPSIYEGFGLPVLESMKMSTPVAASVATSLPYIEDKGAYFFNPECLLSFTEAIEKLESDLRSGNVVKPDQKLLSKFSYENMTDVIVNSI